MIYKLFIEDGDYRDIDTLESRNMMQVHIAYTPEGIDIGWDRFNSIEEAMQYYNIELKPIDKEEQWDVI